MPVGVVAVDDDGIAGWCNRRAADLLRTDVGDIVGHRVDHLAERAAQFAVDVTGATGERRVLILRETAEVDAARLDFFARVSDELSSSLNLDRTLSRIVGLAVPRLADACYIGFTDGRGAHCVGAVTSSNGPASLVELELSAADTVAAVARVQSTGVAELHRDLAVEDVDQFVPLAATWDPVRRLSPTAALVVPLRARSAPIGALVLLAGERAPYTSGDLAVAEGFARRAAVAIDNALIYRDRSSAARILQDSLLPDQLPQIDALDIGARYRPLSLGSEIGGDFYDVFEVSGGRWIVAVGDACGKGVQAATLTGLTRHTIRALAEDHALTNVLHRLNGAVRQRPGKTFCTVALASVRPSPSGTSIEVATGGHPPPFVVRTDGSIEQLATRGTLIGMLADVEFTPQSVHLQPGDALVLYTDGVIEARAGRREFGLDGLRRVLETCPGQSSDTIAARIVQEVADFVGGPQSDDIAVVVVRPVAP